MAYTKITQSVFNRVAKKYGDNSVELKALSAIADARLPFESLAPIFGVHPDDLKADLTGGVELDDNMHTTVVNGCYKIATQGITKGVFPMRETAVATATVRLIFDNLLLEHQNSSLKIQLAEYNSQND